MIVYMRLENHALISIDFLTAEILNDVLPESIAESRVSSIVTLSRRQPVLEDSESVVDLPESIDVDTGETAPRVVSFEAAVTVKVVVLLPVVPVVPVVCEQER